MTFWTTAELRRLGKSTRDIERAAESGAIRPVRKGHWTPPDPAPGRSETVSAFRRGARPPDRLHVAVPRTAARLRDPDDPTRSLVGRPDVVVHWTDASLLAGTGRDRIAHPLLLLAHAFGAQPPERALAVVESALAHRHLRTRDLPALAAMLPAHLRPVLDQAGTPADSGLETIVRTLLRARGLHVEALVPVDRVGEVDLLVEGRLILELDGREFHDDEDAFERDRRRDVEATIGRYRVLRLTWYQVLYRWDRAEAAILAALLD